MTEHICIEPECSNPAPHAPKMNRCGSCHYRWQREHGKKHAATCSVCDVEYVVYRKPRGKACCSPECRQRLSQPIAAAARAEQQKAASARPKARQCEWCYALHLESTSMCSDDCRRDSALHRGRSQWSPLRAAVEAGDYAAIASAIGLDVKVTDSGCHEWQRTISADGYPQFRYGSKKKYTQVHRLSLEAKLRRPLGAQTAHHICANTRCVNPDHLQQATHRENIGEMIARNDYVRRIVELESVVRQLDPTNPVLASAPLAGVLQAS